MSVKFTVTNTSRECCTDRMECTQASFGQLISSWIVRLNSSWVTTISNVQSERKVKHHVHTFRWIRYMILAPILVWTNRHLIGVMVNIMCAFTSQRLFLVPNVGIVALGAQVNILNLPSAWNRTHHKWAGTHGYVSQHAMVVPNLKNIHHTGMLANMLWWSPMLWWSLTHVNRSLKQVSIHNIKLLKCVHTWKSQCYALVFTVNVSITLSSQTA